MFDEYPKITEWMKRIESLPGVREYLERRPVPVDIRTELTLKQRAQSLSCIFMDDNINGMHCRMFLASPYLIYIAQ